MKKILLTVLMVLSTLAMSVNDADAKRLGGGGSIGRQSQNISRQQAPAQQAPNQANQASQARPVNAASPSAAPARPWKGILGGALLGLGLGALLSHFGFGGAAAGMIAGLLMLVFGIMILMFVFRAFRRKPEADPYQSIYAAASTPSVREMNSYSDVSVNSTSGTMIGAGTLIGAETGSNGTATSATWQIPADFDVQGFERHAQTYFIRLQAAWDKADIVDIREFTTPAMYAEIKLQIQERGSSANVTDVLSVNAKLMGIETIDADYLASVRFTGTIKEAPGAVTESFNEVWNLVKPVSGQGGWLLAGIQQAD